MRALPYVERNGALVDMTRVERDGDLMVVTDGGTIIRLPIGQVNVYSRYAKGVRIINPADGEKVVSIHPVDADDPDDDLIEGAEDGEGIEAAEVAEDDAGLALLEASAPSETSDSGENAEE